jgi:hypothetical protein
VSQPDTFGYIAHSTINVGDDFQSIAAKQFLPEHAIAVDREFIAEFAHRSRVRVVVSGWFMHQAGSYWDLPVAPPRRSWPPAPSIDPFFISLHLTQTFQSTVFESGNLDYLRSHAPIGARDFYTLDALQQHGIPSYFSGCLTLALPGKPTSRRDVIYAVDVDDAVLAHITARTETPVRVLTHGKPILPLLSPAHRLQYADYMLGLYRSAKCVVTTRLHAALPCLAFETPVLMISSQTKGWPNPRFGGLIEHLRHGSEEELTSGELNYDFDEPPPNPTTYRLIRDTLSRTMTEWVGRTETGSAGADLAKTGFGAPPHDNRFARAEFVSSLIEPGDVGVEIGVLLGVFAYHVLLRREPSRLYLIDPWEYGLQADLEPAPTPEKQAAKDEQFEMTRRLFERCPNVEILRMKSHDAASLFSDGSLDYVYIDGEHSYEAVTRDLDHYLPKVKVGGHLIGDDYGWSGVGAAVDEFHARHAGELSFLVDPYSENAGGQFAFRKLSGR